MSIAGEFGVLKLKVDRMAAELAEMRAVLRLTGQPPRGTAARAELLEDIAERLTLTGTAARANKWRTAEVRVLVDELELAAARTDAALEAYEKGGCVCDVQCPGPPCAMRRAAAQEIRRWLRENRRG